MTSSEHVKLLAYQLANRTTTQVAFETGLIVLITILAVLGNSSVLYVLYKSPRLRSVITNYYLITLAISDVAFAVVVMPLAAATSAVGREIAVRVTCHVIGFIGYSLVAGSLQTVTLIAVNRFFCVVKPNIYRKYFKPKPAALMIIGVWIFSVCNIAVVVGSGIARYEFFPGRFVSLLVFRNKITEQVLSTFAVLTFIALPMSIVGISYWKVLKAVKAHNETVGATLNQGPINGTLCKEEVHVTKSVLALVCGFVICWIPCSTVFLLSVFIDLPRGVEMIFIYSAFLSSAINPIVFNIFNRPFRREFVKVFHWGRRTARIIAVQQGTASTTA